MTLPALPPQGSTSWYDHYTALHNLAAQVDTGRLSSTGPSYPKVFNVQAYGAKGDGTTDDTAAIQAALDAANAAGGGIVYLPKGTYLSHDLTGHANVELRGEGWETVLKQATATPGVDNWLYSVNANSGGSADPTTNATNITIRDLTMRGYVDVDTTFNQQRHLVNLNAVSDVLIQHVQFVGWHGDAIYLGSGNSAGLERHNQRVKIVNCTFDGLTKNNRNCVSVIDGDGVLVEGCTARRHTASNMPGFVDIEPNSGSGAYVILRDIRIANNSVSDHNGNFVQVNLPDASYTTQPCRVTIIGNTDDAGAANSNTAFFLGNQNRTPDDSSAPNDVVIADNMVYNHQRAYEIDNGIVGVTFIGNHFNGMQNTGLLGYSGPCRYFRFEANTFYRCSTTDGYVFRVINANYVSIMHNRFIDCGLPNGTQGIIVYFGSGGSAGTSSNIDYISNAITGTRTTAISLLGTHTLNAASNLRRGYRENGLTFNAAHFGTTV